MLFVEFRFFAFFLLVFLVYWTLPSARARKLWLLGTSYVFYGLFDWRFLSLILASTAIDFVAGRAVHAARTPGKRRAWLLFSLGGNLGLLGFFKYFDFFIGSVAQGLEWFGFEPHLQVLGILLPVGISFYTFQTLSYTLDIYARRLEPVRSPIDLALFVAFFPQLVAGPIVRAAYFLPQLDGIRRFRVHVRSQHSLAIFFIGFVKKSCISDNLAPYVDQVFSNPQQVDSLSAWLGILLFHVQVYCDFSGYSDMAIGLAGLLGYRLPKNFDFPYFTRSMTEFWRHWHITLNAWFTKYVYVPLGGNRREARRVYFNVVAVFFLSGVWHGAGWTFICFGLLHGIMVALERSSLLGWVRRLPFLMSCIYVNVTWVLILVLFRAPTMEVAGAMYQRMLLPFLTPDGQTAVSLSGTWWWVLGGLLVVHAAMHWTKGLERAADAPARIFAPIYGAAWALALPWVASDYAPFVYFKF